MAPTPVLLPGEGNGAHPSAPAWRRQWRPPQCSCLEKAMAPHSSAAWKTPQTGEPGGLQSMGSQTVRHLLSDFTFTFHFHALEKAMAPHSSAPTWKTPRTEEPGRLQARDGRAWWAAISGVAQSRTQLKRLSSSCSSSRWHRFHPCLGN